MPQCGLCIKIYYTCSVCEKWISKGENGCLSQFTAYRSAWLHLNDVTSKFKCKFYKHSGSPNLTTIAKFYKIVICQNWQLHPIAGRRGKHKLTHWGRDKIAAIFQTTFSNAFLTLGLFGRRVIVVTCVCPSVRLSVCLSVCSPGF